MNTKNRLYQMSFRYSVEVIEFNSLTFGEKFLMQKLSGKFAD